MKLTKSKLALAAIGLVLAGGVLKALHPPLLVSLDVQNEELRSVVRKIERQTREAILVHKDLNARITFNVRKMPLEGVLTVLGDQASALWTTIYPLYSTKQSLALLEQALMGEPVAGSPAWTNMQNAPMPRPGGMFAEQLRQQSQYLSLNIVNQDLEMTSLAISRFAQAQLVPENGTKAQITLQVSKVPVPKAVAKVAKQAKRNWTRLFVLQPRPKRPPMQLAQPGRASGPFAPPPGMPPPPPSEAELAEMTPEQRQRVQQQQDFMRQQMEAQLQAMPPAQRAQAMQMRQQMEAMRNMTPQQRQQAMAQMGGGSGGAGPGPGGPSGGGPGGGGQTVQSLQQLNSTLLNSTSDQRVERARQMQSK